MVTFLVRFRENLQFFGVKKQISSDESYVRTLKKYDFWVVIRPVTKTAPPPPFWYFYPKYKGGQKKILNNLLFLLKSPYCDARKN